MPRRSTGTSTVTIGDVAAVAGVSRATASRALNDSPLVTAETKAKVDAAVRQTGFVMSKLGRALAVGRSEAIAVLVTEPLDELFEDPTYAMLLRGITEGLSESASMPVLFQAATEREYDRAIKHFKRRSVDAVISISPYVGGEILDTLTQGGPPVVLCGQLDGDPYRGVFSTVYSDDVEGAALAASLLKQRGRKRVGVIAGPADNPAATDRIRGYRSVLGRIPARRVIHTGWGPEGGFAATRTLLERYPDLDGILAGSDRMALGCYAALALAGRSVPQDVSVIGFDDHSVAAAAEPPLTTIRQPLLEEGRIAAQLALSMVDGAAPESCVLHMQLIERASV